MRVLGATTAIVGTSIHVADSYISGFDLNALATAWASVPAPEQSTLLRVGDTLLYLLNGTWRSVHSYFHGLPFILSGTAVALSRRYPPWLGWIGAAGGTASFLGGVLQFIDVIPGSERLVIVSAQAVNLWIVAMRVLMWRRAWLTETTSSQTETCQLGARRSILNERAHVELAFLRRLDC